LPTRDISNAVSVIANLPAAIAPDGSPVAVYLVLPARDEANLIHCALPRTASILDLGCGTGRISQWLAEQGHRIVAVDQSLEMLRHVPRHSNIVPIHADIEALTLDWKFDGVVLASYLVNTADQAQRARFLVACRDHVTEHGIVVIQRVDPATRWVCGATSFFGSVRVRLVDATLSGCVIRARLEYQIGGQVFEQAIAIEVLDDLALAHELAQAELRFGRWLDPAKTWLVAHPIARSRARSC
jgi:SAM-dependent methyltransferase